MYVSIYACSKALEINAGIIKLCCEKKKKLNIGRSKKDDQVFTFDYTTDDITIQPNRKITIHATDDARIQARRQA